MTKRVPRGAFFVGGSERLYDLEKDLKRRAVAYDAPTISRSQVFSNGSIADLSECEIMCGLDGAILGRSG